MDIKCSTGYRVKIMTRKKTNTEPPAQKISLRL